MQKWKGITGKVIDKCSKEPSRNLRLFYLLRKKIENYKLTGWVKQKIKDSWDKKQIVNFKDNLKKLPKRIAEG